VHQIQNLLIQARNQIPGQYTGFMKPFFIKKQKGISLVELLFAIFLISIITNWSIRSWYSHQQKERLLITARSLRIFLNELQANAYWYNRTDFLWVYYHSGTWCIGSGNMELNACEKSKNSIYKPNYKDISLSHFPLKNMAFYGRRNTAQPGHFTLTNSEGCIRLIISKQGRIRLCSQNKKIADLPLCR